MQECEISQDMISSDEDEVPSKAAAVAREEAAQNNAAIDAEALWDNLSPFYKLHLWDMVFTHYSHYSRETRRYLLQLTEPQVQVLIGLILDRQDREAEEEVKAIRLRNDVRIAPTISLTSAR